MDMDEKEIQKFIDATERSWGDIFSFMSNEPRTVKNSKHERPEESFPPDKDEEIALKFIRSRWKEDQISDITALKIARAKAGKKHRKVITKCIENWYKNRTVMMTYPEAPLESSFGSDDLPQALATFGYGRDIQGHPVLYCSIGKIDITRMFENADLSFKYGSRLLNRMHEINRKNTLKTGLLQHRFTWILDAKDVSITTLLWYCDSIRKAINRVYGVANSNVFYLFLLNPAWIIEKMLTFFSPTDKLKGRTVIIKDYSELDHIVKPDQRPIFYGGTCKAPVRWGDVVHCDDDDDVVQMKGTLQDDIVQMKGTLQDDMVQIKGTLQDDIVQVRGADTAL